MKRKALWLGLLLAACAGVRARDEVLLPAMQLAWPAVREDADRGAAAASLDPAPIVAFGAALEGGNRLVVAQQDWEAVRRLAIAGIQDRVQRAEITEGVAESLREQVRQFTRMFLKLQEK